MAVTELAPVAARLGLDGVEYREVYWRDKATELPAVREQVARLGLRLTYCTFTPLFNADPAARQQLLADIDDAAALGSPLLRVFLGVRDLPATPAAAPPSSVPGSTGCGWRWRTTSTSSGRAGPRSATRWWRSTRRCWGRTSTPRTTFRTASR